MSDKSKNTSWTKMGVSLALAILMGLVGLKICTVIGVTYTNLASKAVWNYEKWFFLPRNEYINNEGKILQTLGVISTIIIVMFIFALFVPFSDLDWWDWRTWIGILQFLLLGTSAGILIFFLIIYSESLSHYRGFFEIFGGEMCSTTGTIFGTFIGTLSGIVTGIIVYFRIGEDRDSWDIIITALLISFFGLIVGRVFFKNGLLVSSPLIVPIALIGYIAGEAIGKWVVEWAEIRRIRKEEREEEKRRISEIKAKYEQYKREGYEPDKELEDMLK